MINKHPTSIEEGSAQHAGTTSNRFSIRNALMPMMLSFIIAIAATGVLAQSDAVLKKSVMIIPYDPYMYFSDADEQLAKQNGKSIKEVRTLFRYGINLHVNAKILSAYSTRPLLTDTAKTASEDLYQIYKGVSYFKDKSMPSPTSETTDGENPEKKKLFALTKKSSESEAQTAAGLKQPNMRHEYMNVKIHDKRMLTYLKEKYGTELFVFINQLDLVTNYEHCLDRATNTFERDIKIHFSVLDYNGNQLAGDLAIAHFPSNSNDINEIIRDNFPIIADYLAGKISSNGLKVVKEQEKGSSVAGEQLEYIEFDDTK